MLARVLAFKPLIKKIVEVVEDTLLRFWISKYFF